MKKIAVKSTLLLIIAGAVILSFTQCRKDTDIEAIITVKYQSDTNIVVPNATVILSKYDVFVTGTTNSSGVFNHTFKLEAILDIAAAIDTSTITATPELTGESVIRLEAGKTIRKTVFIN